MVTVDRHVTALPARVGLVVYGDADRVNTVVVDGRPGLCAAACRMCGTGTYDRPLLVAARWLVSHLREHHGAGSLDVDAAPLRREWGLGPSRFDAARTVERAVAGPMRGAA